MSGSGMAGAQPIHESLHTLTPTQKRLNVLLRCLLKLGQMSMQEFIKDVRQRLRLGLGLGQRG